MQERRPQDSSRISLSELWEVKYWCEILEVSEDELRNAVQSVGTSVRKVREYLNLAATA